MKKGNYDLRPALQFVALHRERYETAVRELMDRPPMRLPIYSYPGLCILQHSGTQLHPVEIREIVGRLPQPFRDLSLLSTIDYEHASTVPVPIFSADGSWIDVDFVPEADFPRPGQHSGRILIGRSIGDVIYPSALPVCIHEDARIRWLYQLHVFLHEFFHTIEFKRRSRALRESIRLARNSSRFTFEQWWNRWEELLLSENRPLFPTRYAATYLDSLTREVAEKDPEKFTRAVAEQICESFVGYILGIAPNDQDEADFKQHSPAAWSLIDDLQSSTVL